MPAAQDVEAARMAVSAYRGWPAATGVTTGRKTPGPGSQRRPGTPIPLLPMWAAEGGAVVTGAATLHRTSEHSQSRGDVVRERYQALEELERSKSLQRSLSRPLMLASVRSFSYELPTQLAEMERMSNLRSSSPPVPPPHQKPHSTPRRSSPRSSSSWSVEDNGGGNS